MNFFTSIDHLPKTIDYRSIGLDDLADRLYHHLNMIQQINQTVYIASKGYEGELLHEVDLIENFKCGLFLANPISDKVAWVQDIWFDPVEIKFDSISHAVNALRSMGRKWVNLPHSFHRRAALIADGLARFKLERIDFGKPLKLKPFGCWALVDRNRIIASTNTYKNYPNGVYEFFEDKVNPPNRAYLKLWEFFTTFDIYPNENDLCLDLGASPGGWSWVLYKLKSKVISVDKSQLDNSLMGVKDITYLDKSAFSLDPSEFPKATWLFCDVVCYPTRLIKMVERWLKDGRCKKIVCTVKFQGKTDFAAIDHIKSINNSNLLHLYHNKHELTWFIDQK